MRLLLFINKKSFIFSTILYALLAIVLLPLYRYQMNPDAISYMCIAQKYMNLDFSNAVSGYWGPLISWLLIPFLKVGIDPVLSLRLLNIIIGFVILIQSNSVIKKMEIKGWLKFLFLFVILFMLLDYALYVPTPDVLFLSVSLALVNLMIKDSYTKLRGVLCGVLGALLYYTKGYGLPFFLIVFTTINLLFYFRIQDKKGRINVLKAYILGIVTFCFISSFWVFALSHKFGEFTYATNAKYANALVAPGSPGHHPMGYKGLLKPPNNTAISVWEDISFTEVKHWNKFGSVEDLLYQFTSMIKTLYFGYKMIHKFSYLGIIILLISIIYLIEKGKKLLFEKIFILLLFFVPLMGGYVFILYLEDRYIWLCSLIILIIGVKMIEYLFAKIKFKKVSQVFIVIVFGMSFLTSSLRSLRSRLNIDKDVLELSNNLKELGLKGNVASSGRWNRSLYLAFYNDWRYFGFSEKDNIEFEEELISNEIDYLIVWNKDKKNYTFCQKYKKVTDDKFDNELKIYKLR